MRLNSEHPQHLTYCLNVHPGETWEENLSAIRAHVPRIRDAVAPGRAFGLGLRLSCEAAGQLTETTRLQELRSWLEEEDLYVFTINGFPYGRFHGAHVKEAVYRPDWRTEERKEYTCLLADILAKLLPPEVSGSVSTVPCSYKAWMKSDADIEAVVRNLVETVAHLHTIHRKTGREIHLGLEPEPDCFLETTSDVVTFFTRHLADRGADMLSRHFSCSGKEAQAILARHIGVCFDTCHLSLQFENLSESLNLLARHHIRISKVQVSAALKTSDAPDARQALIPFRDPVYLHQVKIRDSNGVIRSHPDLAPALDSEQAAHASEDEWRIHFHVPLYFAGDRLLKSTAGELTPTFFKQAMKCGAEHFEVETYTFDVLPPELKARGIDQSVEDELRWCLNLFHPLPSANLCVPCGSKTGMLNHGGL